MTVLSMPHKQSEVVLYVAATPGAGDAAVYGMVAVNEQGHMIACEQYALELPPMPARQRRTLAALHAIASTLAWIETQHWHVRRLCSNNGYGVAYINAQRHGSGTPWPILDEIRERYTRLGVRIYWVPDATQPIQLARVCAERHGEPQVSSTT